MSAGTRTPRQRRRPGQLPSGRHGLAHAEVVASQRQRMLRAMTDGIAAHGYDGASIKHVVDAAGVSRRTFYDLFASKEDCFAAAHAAALERLAAVAGAAYGTEGRWPDRLRPAVAALLGVLAADPALARLCFAEGLTTGPAASARRDDAIGRLAVLFEADEVRASPLAAALVRGRLSELADLLRGEVLAGRTARLAELAPQVMYAMVVAFAGRRAAAAELERAGVRAAA